MRLRFWISTCGTYVVPNTHSHTHTHALSLSLSLSHSLSHTHQLHRDRWGTLFSIDDMVAGVVATIKKLAIEDHTYVMFTSDHGYHLGQFRIPDEKMMPYETDIRVPFFAMGPKIRPGTLLNEMISNIDIGPTLCDLAGLAIPTIMDGRSLVPLLTSSNGVEREEAHGALDRPWRTHFMTEFAEGGNQEWGANALWTTDAANPTYDAGVSPPWGFDPSKNVTCAGPNSQAPKDKLCPANACSSPEGCPTKPRFDYAYDDPGYNWRALRVINATHNIVLAQWDPAYDFGVGPAPTPPASPIKPATYMPQVNINGGDDPSPCPVQAAGNDWKTCEATCTAKAGCLGWTLHYNQPATNPTKAGWRCCTKTTIAHLHHADKNTTSGILHPTAFLAELRESLEMTVEDLQQKTFATTGNITFTEYYDIAIDPWQMKNLWSTTPKATQEALMAEIAMRFACAGTRTTASNCE